MEIKDRLICALDMSSTSEIKKFLKKVGNNIGCIKLGLEYFTSKGPKGIIKIREKYDIPIFLDLKFHDIPNTVSKSIRNVVRLQPKFISLHISGGYDMLKRSIDMVSEESLKLGIETPKLLGVSILTSLSDNDMESIGYNTNVKELVFHMAKLASTVGLDGLVCSPDELTTLKDLFGSKFIYVTPGIRPVWYTNGSDQKRIVVPNEAIKLGADYIVVGRPITDTIDPYMSIKQILLEMKTD